MLTGVGPSPLYHRAKLLGEFQELAQRETAYLGKYARARVYGEGERPGRTLVRLLTPKHQTTYITQLQAADGTHVTDSTGIQSSFLSHYTSLYTTCSPPVGEALTD